MTLSFNCLLYIQYQSQYRIFFIDQFSSLIYILRNSRRNVTLFASKRRHEEMGYEVTPVVLGRDRCRRHLSDLLGCPCTRAAGRAARRVAEEHTGNLRSAAGGHVPAVLDSGDRQDRRPRARAGPRLGGRHGPDRCPRERPPPGASADIRQDIS